MIGILLFSSMLNDGNGINAILFNLFLVILFIYAFWCWILMRFPCSSLQAGFIWKFNFFQTYSNGFYSQWPSILYRSDVRVTSFFFCFIRKLYRHWQWRASFLQKCSFSHFWWISKFVILVAWLTLISFHTNFIVEI